MAGGHDMDRTRTSRAQKPPHRRPGGGLVLVQNIVSVLKSLFPLSYAHQRLRALVGLLDQQGGKPGGWLVWGIGAGMAVNVLSVVAIVGLNKHIQKHLGLDFPVFISFLHFTFNAVALRVLRALGCIRICSQVNSRTVIGKAILDLLSVVLMNISLAKNSVGLFQISKMSMIPVTLVVQYVLWRMTVSPMVLLALIPLCVGIGGATVTDVQLNAQGLMWAALAVAATVTSQLVAQQVYQRIHVGVDALSFLYHTTPYISLGTLVIVPFMDPLKGPNGLLSNAVTCIMQPPVILSCVIALAVNVTNYFVIGQTSAVSFQVLGHFKTFLSVSSSVLLFDYPILPRNILAMMLSFLAMITYVRIRQGEARGKDGDMGSLVWVQLLYATMLVAAVMIAYGLVPDEAVRLNYR